MTEETRTLQPRIRKSLAGLLAYCRENDWAGTDPYDALNSRLFELTPFKNWRIGRIAFIQLLKRLPVDLRPLLLIPKERNAKATALFLMAALQLERAGALEEVDLPRGMIERLISLRSPGTPYWCWGYSFPWQTRTVLVPKGAPNLVSTVFAANALLDAYAHGGDSRCMEMAASAAEYLVDELFWRGAEGVAGFSYPLPALQTRVHNANLLAAALLCRIHRLSGESRFLEPALQAARYSAGRQHPEGSWHYGEGEKQQWVDNFHTGYNLCALREIGNSLGTSEFEPHLRRGFDFYRKHFFTDECAARYFHDRTYPIDIHCVAQSVLTLVTLKDLDRGNVALAERVLDWAIRHMWDERGYFYYQVNPRITNRISYMRWSQAWMLLALAKFLVETDEYRGQAG